MGKWVPVPLPPFIVPNNAKTAQRALTSYGQAASIAGLIALPFVAGTPAAAGAAWSMVAGAGLQALGGALYSEKRRKTLSGSEHYATTQFPNPADPDSTISLLYGTHRVVPAVLSESVSPLVEGSGYGIPAVRKQGLSMLLAICEGQVSDLQDIRVNDQPVLSEERTEEVGKGNGTKKVFELPGRWAYLPSLSITVNGTERRLVDTDTTVVATMPASGDIAIARNPGERILPETLTIEIGGEEQARTGSTFPWSLRVKSKRKVQIVFASRPTSGTRVVVSFSYVGPNDLVTRQDGRGRVKLVFGSAPTSGHKIEATFKRSNFPGLSIDWRPGTLDQEPMTGFHDQRQSYTVGETLPKDTERTYSTSGRKVNDLRVGIVAPNGFVAFTDEHDGTESTQSRVGVYYAPTDASGNLDGGKWRLLYRLSDSDDLRDSFHLVGQTLSKRIWEVSVRDSLQALLDAGYTETDGFAIDEELEKLHEGTCMKVKVVRKDKVNADTSDEYLDRLEFGYATEVGEILLSHPGTALLGLRCIVDEATAGGAPFVSCLATRAPLYDPRTGLFDGRSDNPALAAYDLITSGNGTAEGRYGSRGWFSADDIDLDLLNAWADRCDEWVHNENSDASKAASESNGERRHCLDIVLDSPQSLNETVGDIARISGALVSLQGVKWRFPLDLNEGDAVFAFVDSTDPAAANIVEGSFEEGPDPLEDRPTDLTVEYWDEERDYLEEVVYAEKEGLGENELRIRRSASARGITRASEAERFAKFALESALNNAVSCSWLAHHGAQLVEAGDIVTVTSQVPGGTSAAGWNEQRVRVIGVTKSAPGDGRLPLVRYVGRTLSDRPYNVVAQKPERRNLGAGSGASGNTYPGGFGSADSPGGSRLGNQSGSGGLGFGGRAIFNR